MALVSARATINAIDVLSMLMATYLYNLCQGTQIMESIIFTGLTSSSP